MSGTCIKDTWTKPKGEDQVWEMGMAGVGRSGEGKMEITVLEKQLKNVKKNQKKNKNKK